MVLIGAMDRFHEGDDVDLSCKVDYLLKFENFWDMEYQCQFSVHHNMVRRIAGNSTPALKDQDMPSISSLSIGTTLHQSVAHVPSYLCKLLPLNFFGIFKD